MPESKSPPAASALSQILERIRTRSAHAGVVGLGYVGLPLCMELVRAGFRVTGVDIDARKVGELNAGRSYVGDVPQETVAAAVRDGRFRATTEFEAIAEMDTVNIAVPTPLSKAKEPDLGYIIRAAEEITRYLHPGLLVILESTTYPGTTEEVLQPMFEKGGLRVGVDFFLCFSPERVDPGNPNFQTHNIPKVVGGVTPACIEAAVAFYSQALEHVVPVSSTRVAETVKLLENTFRMINIGLVNELALLCDRMGIDVWEVIEAASTKPFGFMPFYPGPGLGGHCIPIDPFYLSWKTRQVGIEARFIELAGHINSQMPRFVVEKIQNALNDRCKPLKNSSIHLLGVAYKRDIDDVRESPAFEILELLEKRGAKVTYDDPYVPSLKIGRHILERDNRPERVAEADCVVIVTDHRHGVDYEQVLERSQLVVDARNALKGRRHPNLVRL